MRSASMLSRLIVGEGKDRLPRERVFLDAEGKAAQNNITQTIVLQAQNNIPFSHIIFHGAPGIGKTLLAKTVIKESGLDWIQLHEAVFDRYSLDDGMISIRRLFARLQNVSNKVILFLDEFDKWFSVPDFELTPKDRSLRNLFLTLVHSMPQKFLLIVTSVRTASPSFETLLKVPLEIHNPGLEERKEIFLQFLQKARADQTQSTWNVSRLLQRNQSRPMIMFDDELFTDEVVTEVAQKTAGIAGRSIHVVIYRTLYRCTSEGISIIKKYNLLDTLEQMRREELYQ